MKKKEKLQFNAIFRPEPEGGFTVIIPSLPGCITYGRDLKEAKKMAIEAVSGYLATIKKHKEKIQSDENSFISLIQLPLRDKVYA